MAPPKKGGLGKGLNALFADNAIDESEATVQLRIDEIEPNRGQPRKDFDEAALAELADSISQHGVLQPLLVRPLIEGGYQLVAGERRWRASRMAGLTQVPVVIRQMSDQEMMELALIENLQREDLSPVEEAEGFQTLMNQYQLTQEEVARVVGKSRPAIANALRLLALPASVLDLVREGKLSAGHARTLLSFPEEEMERMGRLAVEQELSVRQLEQLAKTARGKKKKSAQTPKRDTFFDEVEILLTQQLGRKIKVNGTKEKGTIEISFYNKEELRGLAELLSHDNLQ